MEEKERQMMFSQQNLEEKRSDINSALLALREKENEMGKKREKLQKEEKRIEEARQGLTDYRAQLDGYRNGLAESSERLEATRVQLDEEKRELDTSIGIKNLGRFRINLYRQRGSIGMAVRLIPFDIPGLEELGLPKVVRTFADRPSGLVLITGATGSGKSTTLASMIEYINSKRSCHIISIEDPIEYLHKHKKSTINQRELGTDTGSFRQIHTSNLS